MYKVQEFFSEANEYLLNSNPVRDRIIGLRLKKNFDPSRLYFFLRLHSEE
ncbi:hypothetical protein LEP1GSC036_0784 [Leptospira weilii str. 2006001853]|uniref:Uncharacterized protein n=3 Tax=Leptospira weilii TaxID=28184 RepID=A0A828Z6S4_9LEPT|nr:hypothetical protein LEP1GSC036_0784 [Leptospira weilii str. 2006001853]EMJ62697.1 hypothetical protein LEP1GSC051_3908 [Leptospira sp. P2653]EMM75015.1 hypothetical protein LEP1GSC038_0938 [Leptospira weilii str. 2006001855]EMN46688.1 hypothetical protein LEP1GSC086_4059 [Leptospira weilii str. LNT 1234]EMN90781.1 hypothetical protein LEP1GSC108_2352 [Leptospira weilii str. UI 13098]